VGTILEGDKKAACEVILRAVKSKTYQTSLPGAPDGEYVVIQFETLFEKKKDRAIETVTPVMDTDGKWRVSGYYIKMVCLTRAKTQRYQLQK